MQFGWQKLADPNYLSSTRKHRLPIEKLSRHFVCHAVQEIDISSTIDLPINGLICVNLLTTIYVIVCDFNTGNINCLLETCWTLSTLDYLSVLVHANLLTSALTRTLLFQCFNESVLLCSYYLYQTYNSTWSLF